MQTKEQLIERIEKEIESFNKIQKAIEEMIIRNEFSKLNQNLLYEQMLKLRNNSYEIINKLKRKLENFNKKEIITKDTKSEIFINLCKKIIIIFRHFYSK